jgi:uncharacterized protein (TIGR00369 family)
MTPVKRSTRESFGVEIPFVQLLGFELQFFEGGVSELTYTPSTEHMNSFQVAHGGAVMTLLDVTMATAARSVDKNQGIVTIEMKTSFMQPATGALLARGKLMHRTRSTAFAEAHLYEAQGQLCAHSTGTFRYVPKRPGSEGPDHSINPAQIATD